MDTETQAFEARLARAAYLSVPTASFILDAECTILIHTRRGQRLYAPEQGGKHVDLAGTSFATLTNLTKTTLSKALREALPKGHVVLSMRSARFRNVAKDVPFHLSLVRSKDVSTQLYMLTQDHISTNAGALQSVNDHRTAIAKALEKAEAQNVTLQRAVLSMETFAHAASHDLRTPINAISGLLQLFDAKFKADLPETAHQYLDHMQRATSQMDQLTTTLMGHARAAAGPIVLERVNLRASVDQVFDGLAHEITAATADVSVRGELVDVMAEPVMLRILLSNLVNNALKYRAEGRLAEVRVDMNTTEDGGAMLRVSDNGIGFPSDQAQAIFAPFLRLNATVEGNGIGLATCAEICRRHNWAIDAQSDGKTGSQFRVSFPERLEA